MFTFSHCFYCLSPSFTSFTFAVTPLLLEKIDSESHILIRKVRIRGYPCLQLICCPTEPGPEPRHHDARPTEPRRSIVGNPASLQTCTPPSHAGGWPRYGRECSALTRLARLGGLPGCLSVIKYWSCDNLTRNLFNWHQTRLSLWTKIR